MATTDANPKAVAGEPQPRRWTFGPAVLDERTLELAVNGEVVGLERKPLEALLHLLRHADQVVTKDQLLEAVWPGRILSETVLTKCIAKLREALGDRDDAIIRTVHGYGYRLVAPVRSEASGPDPAPSEGGRRLAAIMFTDIVGYTALMGTDEAAGIAARDRHREVVRSQLAAFHGRWVEEIGDESFSLFPSALEAVRCALAIHEVLAAEPLKVRIGIHMGDVIERDGRILGDAVNLAARIRGLAEPGGTVVSERVCEDVRNHPELAARPLGEKRLKNVSRPVRVHAIGAAGQSAPAGPAPARRRLVLATVTLAAVAIASLLAWRMAPARPAGASSIAVLPFVNVSPDPENEYFSDGMTEELINALARVEGLRVPSRTSVFAYKDGKKDLRQIGRELEVQTILEGSVRKEGDRLRITAQLISVADGYHLWSQAYERTTREVFAVQNELAAAIVGTIRPRLAAAGKVRWVAQGTANPEAYDAYLRGKYDYLQQDDAANRSAIANLEQAIALDPAFAQAYAALAHAYFNRIYTLAPEDATAVQQGFAMVEKALALDPDLAEAHLARAELLWSPANNFPHEQAIRAVKRALELDDSLVNAWLLLHVIYTHVGLLEQADEAIARALRLDPSNVAVRFLHGTFFLFVGRFEEALEHLERVPRTYNPSYWYVNTAIALGVLGRHQEAGARLAEFLASHSDRGGYVASQQAIWLARSGETARAEEAIRLASGADRRFGHYHHTAFSIGGALAVLNRRTEAVQWLEYSVRTGFPCYPVFATSPLFATLRGDPGFERLLEHARLEWEKHQSLFPPEGRVLSRSALLAPALRIREAFRRWRQGASG